MIKKETVGIIGVQQDFGASKRGVDMGPSAMRIAGLHSALKKLGYSVVDFGNIHCHDLEEHLLLSDLEDKKVRFISHIVQTCRELKQIVSKIVEKGYFPLVLGGDHSISIGTLSGLKSLHEGDTGIIWVDAHGDFNTVLSFRSFCHLCHKRRRKISCLHHEGVPQQAFGGNGNTPHI